MYIWTESAYNRTCQSTYEKLEWALRNACTSIDQEWNEDGTSNITHTEITGPNNLVVPRTTLEEIARQDGQQWESFWRGWANKLQGISEQG